MISLAKTFSLGTTTGLTCSQEGLFLGDTPLLTRSRSGFEPRPPLEIEVLVRAAFGSDRITAALHRGLAAVSFALNKGDTGTAMIAAVHLRLPSLDDRAAARLKSASGALAKYSPDQPRDSHGRWTSEGGGDGTSSLPTRHISGATPAPKREDWGGSRPSGGHLIETAADADDRDDDEPPKEDDQDKRPERDRPPRSWYRPDGFMPTLPDGDPWPEATPDAVRRNLLQSLFPGQAPRMVVYVPNDGRGPLLIGEGDGRDFEQPSGYDRVTLHGTPQVTRSGGAETGHADASVEAALIMAASNRYSDIFFNRSYSTITNGEILSPLRSDVVGLMRPEWSSPEVKWDPFEVLSPRQELKDREDQLKPLPGLRLPLQGHRYKLLKLLLSFLSRRRG